MPLPFVNGLTNAWEVKGSKRIYVFHPCPELESRQCTLQSLWSRERSRQIVATVRQPYGRGALRAYPKSVLLSFVYRLIATMCSTDQYFNGCPVINFSSLGRSRPYPKLRHAPSALRLPCLPSSSAAQSRPALIFRGTGKQVSSVERAAWDKGVQAYF